MSNGRWGARGNPQHMQLVQQQQAAQVDTEAMAAAQEQNARLMSPPLTVDSIIGQARARLAQVEVELRAKTALEAEKAKLERMIAALEET